MWKNVIITKLAFVHENYLSMPALTQLNNHSVEIQRIPTKTL